MKRDVHGNIIIPDAFKGSIETPEHEAKSFTEVSEAQALCARIMDGCPAKAYKPSHGGYPSTTAQPEWKPGRDMPGGYTPV